jgi:glycosyltransferase involved in cell wall biosynthesis
MTTDVRAPTLSIVIPIYNEPDWIGRCVASAVAAVLNSPFDDRTELVIVDDGSDELTKHALSKISPGLPLRVLEQPNRGRLAARRAGIDAAQGELVMMLDSRVVLEPDALRFIASNLDGELPIWNAHVEIDVAGNPFARFWRTVAHAAWPSYLRQPRTMSFGLEDFDRYPKGTTCFLAPRRALARALAEFESLYDDVRFSNDDTVMIRSLAKEQRINISPGFACRYHARDSLIRFVRHSLHRGTVFVDGFGRPGTRFFPVVIAFFPTSLAFGVFAVRKPAWALAAVFTGPIAAAAYAASLRRPPRDVIAFSMLALPFVVPYSAGIWRGGWLALRGRMRS